jgi:hypothetical protein
MGFRHSLVLDPQVDSTGIGPVTEALHEVGTNPLAQSQSIYGQTNSLMHWLKSQDLSRSLQHLSETKRQRFVALDAMGKDRSGGLTPDRGPAPALKS